MLKEFLDEKNVIGKTSYFFVPNIIRSNFKIEDLIEIQLLLLG